MSNLSYWVVYLDPEKHGPPYLRIYKTKKEAFRYVSYLKGGWEIVKETEE